MPKGEEYFLMGRRVETPPAPPAPTRPPSHGTSTTDPTKKRGPGRPPRKVLTPEEQQAKQTLKVSQVAAPQALKLYPMLRVDVMSQSMTTCILAIWSSLSYLCTKKKTVLACISIHPKYVASIRGGWALGIHVVKMSFFFLFRLITVIFCLFRLIAVIFCLIEG